jgi:hypothetical protein
MSSRYGTLTSAQTYSKGRLAMVKAINKKSGISINKNSRYREASLTVEAALVMPIFLYFMIAFLYLFKIFTLQEQIQSEMTRMGLNLSRTAYFYKDFPNIQEALNFDETIFGKEFDIGLGDLTDKLISGCSMKLYAGVYLNKDWINNSCIVDGFKGMDFFNSSISNNENNIDIIVKYKIRIPIKIFAIGDRSIYQRVRIRAWTGYEVAAAYDTKTEKGNDNETLVYITTTGSVYHKSKTCSHIKLSIRAVQGIPDELRNDSGAKYKRCEKCCTGQESADATYYITSDGTRYHTTRNCSAIMRNVKEIPISDVGSRKPCSRCYK